MSGICSRCLAVQEVEAAGVETASSFAPKTQRPCCQCVRGRWRPQWWCKAAAVGSDCSICGGDGAYEDGDGWGPGNHDGRG